MTERKFTPPTSFPAEYVTRDGVKVTLLAKGTGEAPYCGQFEYSNWIFFRGDGSCAPCPAYDLHDLPKTNVQWANDYEEIFGCTWHDSREEADANAMWDCIAVIRREWTEGQPPEYFTEEARMSNDLVKRLRHPVGGMRPTISDGRAAADRIEELEAANRGLVRLNETTEARAEAAETLLSEVVRALINIERIYYMEAANPDPATIRRMAAQMNGVANTVLSSLSLESEEVARIMMTQAVRETQE